MTDLEEAVLRLEYPWLGEAWSTSPPPEEPAGRRLVREILKAEDE